MNRHILVTGANGQLGRALRQMPDTERWLFTDARELDITDKEAVDDFFDRTRPGIVINCAAYTDVDGAEADRETAFRVNRDAVSFLAKASRRHDSTLVHISTDFVFGGADCDSRAQPRPFTEEDEPAPLNVYGESKLAGERAVLASGVRGAVVRTSWLYSPWGRNFVRSILSAAASREEIRVVADQVGRPTSAVSLADAIVQMIPSLTDTSDSARIFHYCDAGETSRADFAVEIIAQADLQCRVVPVSSGEYPSPAARPRYSVLDTARITRELGIIPPTWKEQLKIVMEWM